MLFFLRYKILKAQERIRADEWYYLINQFILASTNSRCNTHILFMYHMHCTFMFNVPSWACNITKNAFHYEYLQRILFAFVVIHQDFSTF